MGSFYGVIKWLLGSSEWLLWRYYAGSRVLWLVTGNLHGFQGNTMLLQGCFQILHKTRWYVVGVC